MREFNEFHVQIAPAKLEIPDCPSGFVARPALMEALARLMQQKLTCIVSPLGSGKTIALAEFAREMQGPNAVKLLQYAEEAGALITTSEAPSKIAWLSLDERDSDPQRFWSHVFAALSLAYDEESFFENIVEIANEQITLESTERAAALLFDAHNRSETTLILDGIDCVKNDEIDRLLLHFIAYTPREFRVFVSAQRLSETMEYGSYDLGQIQLGYHDLLFTQQETKQILEAAEGICDCNDEVREKALRSALSDGGIGAIYSLSEGWPQGVMLARQSLVACLKRGYAFKFGGASNPVKRYFSSVIFSFESSGLTFAFKVLSLLERFNKPLFKEVFAAYPNLRDQFDCVITRGGGLVLTCDEDGEWYRFNRLFADWIRRGFHSDEKHAIRKGCLAASEWFNRKGYAPEAAKCLLMSVDFGYVSNVVEATSGQECKLKDEDAFVWVSQIPSERFTKSPLLSLLAAWAYNVIGRIKDAEEWLEIFRKASEKSPKLSKESAELAIKFLEAKHLAMIGDNQRALQLNEELLRETHLQEHSLSSMLYQSIAEANQRFGRLKIAEEMFLQAQASASVDNVEHHLYFNMFSYAKVRFDQGDFDECEMTCKKLLDICPDEFVFKGAGYALLAMVHIERNELEEGELDVASSLEAATPYQNVDMYLFSRIAQSTLIAAKGDLANAYEVISEAVMYGEKTLVPMNGQLSAYFKQSEIAFRRGNDRDLQIIERKFRMCADEDDAYHGIMYQIVFGHCLRQHGQEREAAAAYAEAAGHAKEIGAAFMEAKALSALLLCDDESVVSKRSAMLGRLIQIANSCGFLRVFLDAGAPMRDILRKYSSSSHVNAQTRKYVKGILVLFERELHRFQSIEDVQNAHIGKLDNLTAREREVLGLLNMGMSRKEIADTLCVSINTAKKHLSNIYAKLGVQNRDQALDVITVAPGTGSLTEAH